MGPVLFVGRNRKDLAWISAAKLDCSYLRLSTVRLVYPSPSLPPRCPLWLAPLRSLSRQLRRFISTSLTRLASGLVSDATIVEKTVGRCTAAGGAIVKRNRETQRRGVSPGARDEEGRENGAFRGFARAIILHIRHSAAARFKKNSASRLATRLEVRTRLFPESKFLEAANVTLRFLLWYRTII